MRLRLIPVHADRLYADIGGPATTASMAIEGRKYGTAELRVSFLAVDSTGEHETGDAVAWTNRITLKSREYMDGNERMVEIQSAPPVPIRYTTDGSDPKHSGGSYEGAFAIPNGTRMVLAVAEKDGISSEVLRREIGEQPEARPIDRSLPLVWRPVVCRFVSWDLHVIWPDYSVDGLPGMVEQSGKLPVVMKLPLS